MLPKLAILHTRNERFSPSNEGAIAKFMDAAIKNGLYPTVIEKDDVGSITEYDALFIRDTTNYEQGHYTRDAAIKAASVGMPCLDHNYDIWQCTDKVRQTEIFNRYFIRHPKTSVIDYKNWRTMPTWVSDYPIILKRPDSCFSRGVFKIDSKSMYMRLCTMLFDVIGNKQLLVQEFMPTKYDWRIGMLDNEIIFAVKYYMPENDFRIIKYDRDGNLVEGAHIAIPIDKIPFPVMKLAHQVSSKFGYGLYGIDIKHYKNNYYAIEINDNPTIDHGVEDEANIELYEDIILWFKGAIKNAQMRHVSKTPDN